MSGRNCTGCGRRQQMLADAWKQGGMKQILKAIPAVIRDTVKGEPNIRKRKWPK